MARRAARSAESPTIAIVRAPRRIAAISPGSWYSVTPGRPPQRRDRGRDPRAGRRDPRGPTDSRIVPGPIPAPASSSSESWRWVVLAGWMTRLRTSPTFARWLQSVSALDEALARLAAAREVEREHGARPAREVLRGERLARRVPDCGDLGPRREELRDAERVLDVPVHPQAQRLDPLQEEEGVERAERGAEVAQRLGAQLHQEAVDAERLVERETVVGGRRVGDAPGSGRSTSRTGPSRRRRRRSTCRGRRGTSSPSGRRCRRRSRAAGRDTASRTCCRRRAARPMLVRDRRHRLEVEHGARPGCRSSRRRTPSSRAAPRGARRRDRSGRRSRARPTACGRRASAASASRRTARATRRRGRPARSSVKKTAACAARPLANATAPAPPSRLATRSSSTATVGFMMRE